MKESLAFSATLRRSPHLRHVGTRPYRVAAHGGRLFAGISLQAPSTRYFDRSLDRCGKLPESGGFSCGRTWTAWRSTSVI